MRRPLLIGAVFGLMASVAATLTGTSRDATGPVMPGVSVILRNAATGLTLDANGNSAGES